MLISDCIFYSETSSRDFSIFHDSSFYLISILSFIFTASKMSKSFSDGADDLNTCCRGTVQSKRKVGAGLLKELSRLISSLHSAVCRLRNREEPLDASENPPVVADNWEFIM